MRRFLWNRSFATKCISQPGPRGIFSLHTNPQFLLPLKARLHRRFLSRQLDAMFVALKLHQVSNMFKTPAISR